MDKILIVEDNEGLYNLIKNKLESKFEIDIVHSFDQLTQTVGFENDYFLSIVNYKLADTVNGEAIDYVLAMNIPVIVFKSDNDINIDSKLIHKGVISVIPKNSVNDVMYVLSIIDRFSKNRHSKVLIVGDSKIYRQTLINEVNSQLFITVEVNDGKEALKKIKEDINIKVMLTDNKMYQMDGIELTKHIRREFSKERIGIIAVLKDYEKETITKFLRAGANDIMDLKFTKEEFISRMTNTMEAIENYERMESAAHKDYLTGLYNRRYFFTVANKYLNTITEDTNLSIVMVDIDFFKKVNDTYGHEAGDFVLRDVSTVFYEHTKNSDIVCRYGGEEFLLLLKNIDEENTLSLVNKMRIAIEALNIKYKEEIIKITISGGIHIKKGNEDLEEMIQKADNKLYQSKNNGRNLITK